MGEIKLKNLKALVVDDHMTVHMMIENTLKAMGVKTIDYAPSVAHAEDKMDSRQYDIVFVDLKLPGKSGYDLVINSRKEKKNDKTAFIVISAESEEHYVIDALSAGATSYIVKPPEEEKIRDHVTKAITWIAGRK
jgi:DNA-binding response OmpR family regulator